MVDCHFWCHLLLGSQWRCSNANNAGPVLKSKTTTCGLARNVGQMGLHGDARGRWSEWGRQDLPHMDVILAACPPELSEVCWLR